MTANARARALVARCVENTERSRLLCQEARFLRVRAYEVRGLPRMHGGSDGDGADPHRAFLQMFAVICVECFARITDQALPSAAAWLENKLADGSVASRDGSCVNCEHKTTVYRLA